MKCPRCGLDAGLEDDPRNPALLRMAPHDCAPPDPAELG